MADNSTVVRFSLPCLPRDQVVRAVATQRERFELAGPMKARARECCDLVLVSLYVFIPPSRGLEIRTLEVLADGEQFDRARLKDRNAMLMKDDGVVLYFHNYKTKRFSGRDELALQVRFLVFSPFLFVCLFFFVFVSL